MKSLELLLLLLLQLLPLLLLLLLLALLLSLLTFSYTFADKRLLSFLQFYFYFES